MGKDRQTSSSGRNTADGSARGPSSDTSSPVHESAASEIEVPQAVRDRFSRAARKAHDLGRRAR